jgi:orotidine-5'-phosphate decarboxylase
MKADKRLIVALDVPTLEQMKALVVALGDTVNYYKVGMELFYGAGAEAISYLRSQGKEVFLDLKLHDIPNTVAQSARVLTRLGATMFNIHASGGLAMMKAAAGAVAETAGTLNLERPKLIAVTVLTSMNAAEWSELGYTVPIASQAAHLARLAKEAGLDGVVASPQEAPLIRRECGPDFLIVTPGVRPVGSAGNDQSRVATPAGALAAGASQLVIGRPITAAPDPKAAAAAILAEMEG